MAAGIIAGSIAAVLAALVSLPLHSPDDILLNTATVVVGSLAAGLAAGLLWRALAARRNRLLQFSGFWTIAFVAAALISLVGETQLDRFLAFVLPLAAIVYTLTGLFTVVLGRRPIANDRWLALAAVAIALAVGIPLAGIGDQESGRLELPPRASLGTPSPGSVEGQEI